MEQDKGASKCVSFTIPSCPNSVNSLYNVIFSLKRVELKPECLLWKSQAKGFMPKFESPNAAFLRMDVTFTYPLFHKNGKLKKRDSSNMLKLLQDAIAERYGLDDKFITQGSWVVVDAPEERTDVLLSEISL